MSELTLEQKLRKLREPFEHHEIEWRVQTNSKDKDGKPWVLVVPYLTSRGVQDRLDDVIGATNWSLVQKPTPCNRGYLAGLSIKHDGEWITKWDGAEFTNIEPLKGALSGALKRAAVLWGIGRYLYDLDTFWADCAHVPGRYNKEWDEVLELKDKGKKTYGYIGWNHPIIPAAALPKFNIKPYLNDIRSASTPGELDGAIREAVRVTRLQNNQDAYKEAEALAIKKRGEFKQQAELSLAADFQSVTEWVQREAKTLELVPDPRSLKTIYETLLKNLTNKVRNTAVDPESFEKQITEAYNAANEKFQKDAA